ncbi:2'-5' RNA ligase family protein [Pedobacter africanus]|uniref:2'-5' RNA ligase n=1 Tax=Pedobacter africanus TaxID=151894 RepID=A0A1W2AIU9_9SPHI|nr:2'-5' RNA ligase family protein [Pedobacter africanus]SMC60371.1 2'-5' RNA ligase [Pedobacter africanus]
MESLYFVAILPPQEISAEIDEIRKQCSIDHKVYTALKPPVHITLAPPFKLNSQFEPKLFNSLELARNFPSFNQELKNFDGFPSHTVYINALKNPFISALFKTIKNALKPYSIDNKGSITPHVTIAYRDLSDAYPQIMEEYKRRKYKAEFTVNKFSLLKHDGKNWNLLREFESRPQREQFTIDF